MRQDGVIARPRSRSREGIDVSEGRRKAVATCGSARLFPGLSLDVRRDVVRRLREVGLRPTRQRVALSCILFANDYRHFTAEMLFAEAKNADVPVSLATVYNTLHQLTEVGLLRQIAVSGLKSYFDSNVSDHHHFYIEKSNDLFDIPYRDVIIANIPAPPEGYEVARIEATIRLRRKEPLASV